MAKYQIESVGTVSYATMTYIIEANSPEEARAKFLRGDIYDSELDSSDFSACKPDSEVELDDFELIEEDPQ